jgi:hypothetical protein
MDTSHRHMVATERLVCFNIVFGLKVFMDAHEPVTLEEGDRYPLGPPSFASVSKRKSRCLGKFELPK